MAYRAGEYLDAADLDDIVSRVPVPTLKNSAQSHTSDTTFANDNELVYPMQANSSYYVVIEAGINGTDGDIKTTWSVPSGATGYKFVFGPTLGSTDRTNTAIWDGAHFFVTTVTYGVASATNFAYCRESGLVRTTSAGTFTWQHAQNSSTANATAVTENSILMVTKVG